MARWTDKKSGYTDAMPGGSGNLSFKRNQREELGGLSITKMSQQETDGNMSIVKGHGKYQKFIYTPKVEIELPSVYLDTEIPLFPGNYIAFYREFGKTKLAYLNMGSSGIQRGMFTASGAATRGTSGTYGICTAEFLNMGATSGTSGSANFTDKVFCHAKRFNHLVYMQSGTSVLQELYLIAMSFKLAAPLSITGWNAFVIANPTFSLVTNTANTRIVMTSTVGADLIAVNNAINAYTYISEGTLNSWKFLSSTNHTGDCEDFAITKANRLLGLGYPASALRIAVGKGTGGTAGTAGHAWLVVETTTGDYALDIVEKDVVLDGALQYNNKMRQTGTVWKNVSTFENFRNAVHDGYNGTTGEPNVWWYIFSPRSNSFTQIWNTLEPQQLPYNLARRQTKPMTIDVDNYYLQNFGIRKHVNNGWDAPPDGGIVNHLVNFKTDNTSFFVSHGSAGTPVIFPVRYEEISGTRGNFKVAAVGDGRVGDSSSEFLFVDVNGWLYYTTKYNKAYANAYSVSRLNLFTGTVQTYFPYSYTWTEGVPPYPHTSLYVNCNSFDSIQVASPDNSYTMKIIHDAGTMRKIVSDGSPIEKTETAVFDTIPAGSYAADGLAGTSGADLYFPVPGMFARDLTTAFYDRFICTYTANVGMTYGFSLVTPYGDNINCGTPFVAAPDDESTLPQRKWPIAWFHLQGKTNLAQAFLITTETSWGSTGMTPSFTESDRRIYLDGTNINTALATALGVSIDNILGLVYTPAKEA